MKINGDIYFICLSLLTYAHFHMKIICISNRLIKTTHRNSENYTQSICISKNYITLQKRDHKDCKKQRIKKLTMTLCLLKTLEIIRIKFDQHDYLHMS